MRNIGQTCFLSIGRTAWPLWNIPGMTKGRKTGDRTVWSRVQEAMADRDGPKFRPTQANCAHLLGIKQASISDWSRGGGIKLDHALKLAAMLNVCVEWIYTGRGDKRPVSTDPHLSRIAARWAMLSDITKGRILQIVEDDASSQSKPQTSSTQGMRSA